MGEDPKLVGKINLKTLNFEKDFVGRRRRRVITFV
jgi:hypothetical protein